MLVLPEYFITLLIKMPGALFYHLAIIVSITVTIVSLSVLTRLTKSLVSHRLKIRLSILLALQLVALLIDIAFDYSHGNPAGGHLYLIGNICVIALMLIWLTSAWFSNQPSKTAVRLVTIASVLTIGLLTYTVYTLITHSPNNTYIVSLYVTGWLVFLLVICLTSEALILVHRPQAWVIISLIMAIMAVGIFAQNVDFMNGSLSPIPLRLATLLSFILMSTIIKVIVPPDTNKVSIDQPDKSIIVTDLDNHHEQQHFDNRAQELTEINLNFNALLTLVKNRIDQLLVSLRVDDDINLIKSLEITFSETQKLLSDTTKLNYLVSRQYDQKNGLNIATQMKLMSLSMQTSQAIYALIGYINSIEKNKLALDERLSGQIFAEKAEFVAEFSDCTAQIVDLFQSIDYENQLITHHTNLHRVLSSVIASLMIDLNDKKINLSLDLPDTLPECKISSKLLHYQISRLMSCAIDLSQPESTIELKVGIITNLPTQQAVFNFWVKKLTRNNIGTIVTGSLTAPASDAGSDLVIQKINFVKTVFEPYAGVVEFLSPQPDQIKIILKFPID